MWVSCLGENIIMWIVLVCSVRGDRSLEDWRLLSGGVGEFQDWNSRQCLTAINMVKTISSYFV